MGSTSLLSEKQRPIVEMMAPDPVSFEMNVFYRFSNNRTVLDNILMIPTKAYPCMSKDDDISKDNMLINPSFEANCVRDHTYVMLPAADVPGWSSLNQTPIELWGADFSGVKATHGSNILELDAHGGSKIDGVYQKVKTEKGKKYVISFDVRARGSDVNSNDEAVVLEFNGKKTEKHGYRAAKKGEWTRVSAVVTGTGGEDMVTLRESTSNGANDSTG